MRWAVNLYTTESTKKHLPRIMRAVRRRRLLPSIRLVTIASNEQNLLDIIPAAAYLQHGLRLLNPDIVGIAKDQEEAKELAAQIIGDVWSRRGNFDVRSYFEFRE